MISNLGLALLIVILIANTVIAFVFLNVTLANNAYQTVQERRAGKPKTVDKKMAFIIFAMMLVTPVYGPIFFGCGYLLQRFVFKGSSELGDVMFSKDRVASRNPADEERDRNMVPMEEALAISDKSSLRTLMMNVLKGDTSSYLSAIAKGLNSDDTETAHYAASVLRDELNDFRSNVQDMYNTLETAETSEAIETCEKLLSYMNAFLTQDLFTGMEQKSYVDTMEEVAAILNDIAPDRMLPEYFEWISMRLLEVEKYKSCEYWCNMSMTRYPQELSSYTCSLKLYFKKNEQDRFFAVMNALKESSIVIDKETLELIRTFG